MTFNKGEALKVAIMKSGEILINDKASSLEELDSLLKLNEEKNGVVWYYRESAQEKPTEIALQATKLIIEHKRPVSFSSKPDFSDEVSIKSGATRPREK
jgi:hypothetical protein